MTVYVGEKADTLLIRLEKALSVDYLYRTSIAKDGGISWNNSLLFCGVYDKRKAIEAATPQDNPLYSKLNSARYTVTDEETLKRLTGLK